MSSVYRYFIPVGVLVAIVMAPGIGIYIALEPGAESENLANRGEPALPVVEVSRAQVRYSALNAFSFMDGVDIYQKNGLVEVYGGSYFQRRTGPIRISQSILHPSHSEMWVIWSPDYTPQVDPQYLFLELSPEFQDAGDISAGVVLGDGRVLAWKADLGPAVADSTPADMPSDPRADFVSKIAGASWLEMEAIGRGVFVAEIPQEIREYFEAENHWAIESWFVRVLGNGGAPIPILTLSIGSLVQNEVNPDKSDLVGRVTGLKDTTSERPITLVLESGVRRREVVSATGQFRFSNVPRNSPVSVRFTERELDVYATRGRWFMPQPNMTDVHVDIEATFKDGPKAPSQREFPAETVDVHGESPSDQLSYHRYVPHTRQLLNGSAGIQVTFANNYGFPDRDRDFENRDNCIRLLRTGSSVEMAIQVRPFEKSNILMESELGVRLGRCVEVISMGKDAADLATNFRVIRDYGMKFDPSVVMLEMAFNTIFNLHPALIRAHRGWDFGHNGNDHFRYDSNGKLVFNVFDPNWPLHTVEKQSRPDLEPPIPEEFTYHDLVWLPYEHAHPVGQETFGYLRDILKFYKAEFPAVTFALHSGLEQAECFANDFYCTNKVSLESGEEINRNFLALIDNFSWACQEAGVPCIGPQFPATASSEHYQVPNDGHFSVRGHQWLVLETLDAVAATVKSSLSNQAEQ